MISGVNKAVELDREYQIHQKVGEAVKSAAKTAIQLDKDYQIHQKVGSAITAGVSAVASFISDDKPLQ